MNSKNKKEISEKYKRLGLRSSSSSMEKREETPENYPKWKMREDRHSPEKIEQIKRVRRRKSSSPTMKIRENKDGKVVGKDGNVVVFGYQPFQPYQPPPQFYKTQLLRQPLRKKQPRERKSSSPTMKMREDKNHRRTRRSRSSSPTRKKRESPRRTPSPPNSFENKMFEQEDELAQDIKGFEKYKKSNSTIWHKVTGPPYGNKEIDDLENRTDIISNSVIL
jgi:hypothetical protein